MIQKVIVVKNKLGLHARAANKLIDVTTRCASSIKIRNQGSDVDGKSIMAVLLLAAPKGSELVFTIDGEDEQQALKDIEALFDDLFGEGE